MFGLKSQQYIHDIQPQTVADGPNVMDENKLNLNPDRTELLLVGPAPGPGDGVQPV